MKRIEVFDVVGSIVTRKDQVRVSTLSEEKSKEMNKRMSESFVDFKEIVIQEPSASNGGIMQITMIFDEKKVEVNKETLNKGGK